MSVVATLLPLPHSSATVYCSIDQTFRTPALENTRAFEADLLHDMLVVSSGSCGTAPLFADSAVQQLRHIIIALHSIACPFVVCG